MNIDGITRAPWTFEQVEALNRFQKCGRFHPFTCGNNSGHQDLLATESGWVCTDCDYTQDWAHSIMLTMPPEPA